MASTPFRVVNWSPNELIGEDKMDQMNANMVWLNDNTPRGYYTLPSGLRRVEGLRIASGRILVTARKADSAVASVHFNNLFSSGCQPNITTGIIADFGVYNIACIVNGFGVLNPDNRGFYIGVKVSADSKKNDRIKKSFYVHWQAMGY